MGKGMRLRALFGGIGIVLAALAADVLAATEVRSVRLWRAPDNTRLVFDLSGPVQHSVFTLSAPNRIVIDVNGAQLSAPLDKLSLSNTPITGIRSAQRTPTDLRLVIDLSAAVTPKSFTLAPNQQYGNRLVVDLFDQGAADADDTAPSVPAVATLPATLPRQPATQPTVPSQVPSQPSKLPPVPGGKRDIVVAIDAGHGGEDPGALGPNRSVLEKNVTLAIAKELQRQISAQKGFRGELVRTGDYFIPLRKRTEIARKKGADLFVSIHADAAPSRSAFGASVFALSERGATSETARWLADSENQSDLIGGAGNVSLDDKDRMLAGVLLDLSMTASLSSSLNVGQKVLSHVGGVTPLHKRRVEQAGFMVLKSPDIPSILVETGFISNAN
ncbi:MAG TPA: N-acetylmuramoyl-L-alanine amidase, partial [Pseudomonas sp.]|nr:N-acetylmuramoyl-L-alanine amidase [Pseudomonas sp.]